MTLSTANAVTSRKFFAETVGLPLNGDGIALSSIASLLLMAGYGFELNPTTNAITDTPSMDSFLADALTFIPTSDLYFGGDKFVRDVADPGPPRVYKGVLALAGVPFSITEWIGHVVDPNASWLYSPSGAQDVAIIFNGV